MDDRYGSDVLARDPHGSRRSRSTEVPIELGMVVEDAQTGYVGAVVRVEYGRMELEDRRGRHQIVSGRPGIPGRRQTGHPDRAAPSGADSRRPHRVRLGGGDRGTCPGGPDRTDLRRGPPRRRARRAGVGRRSANRGRGGRIPRWRRRSRRHRRAVPAGPAAAIGRARRSSGAGLERDRGWPTRCAVVRAVRTRWSSGTRSSTSGRPSNRPASA